MTPTKANPVTSPLELYSVVLKAEFSKVYALYCFTFWKTDSWVVAGRVMYWLAYTETCEMCRRPRQPDRGPTVASLAGHGGKVARPIPAGQAGRTLRRAAARRSPHRQRCPSRTRRGANFGKHAAWRNALEHPRFSASDRTKPHDHQPDLARLRPAAASQ